MSSTEKLEELRANMHQQLDLILQSMKAITQDEAESKRFIMEALQKYFGSTALQAKVSMSSSSIFSRIEYPQEKELKPKTDAFGRMRPIDDDDDYGLPFVNKKSGSLGMKSATSSNDEDLLLTHNPFVKGPQLGVRIPSPPSRSGFAGDFSKESSFSAIKTSMKPYYSSRGEKTYQNSTRGRSGARQRSRGGREFENRGARTWENRGSYGTKISYRGSLNGSRGGYDFRSTNHYERSESKHDESSVRRSASFLPLFSNGKSEKIDSFGKPRLIDDDDSVPMPIRKTDAFGKPRPVDDDLYGSPLAVFNSKSEKSLDNQESGTESSHSTINKWSIKPPRLNFDHSKKESQPKIDSFGRPRPVDDDEDYRFPVLNKKDSKLAKIIPHIEQPEPKARKVDAFGTPRSIDEIKEVALTCDDKSIDKMTAPVVQDMQELTNVELLASQFDHMLSLQETDDSNLEEKIFDNEYYWRLKADSNNANCWMYQFTFFLDDETLALSHDPTCRSLINVALNHLRMKSQHFFEFVYQEHMKFYVNRELEEPELTTEIILADLDPCDQNKARGIPREAQKILAKFELYDHLDLSQLDSFDSRKLKRAENFLLAVLNERGLSSKKYAKRTFGMLYGPYEKVFGTFFTKTVVRMTTCLEKADDHKIGFLNISTEKLLMYGAHNLAASIRSYIELHGYSLEDPPFDEMRLLFRGVLVENLSGGRTNMGNILNFYPDDTKEPQNPLRLPKLKMKVEISDGQTYRPENLRIVGDQTVHSNGLTPLMNEKLSQVIAADAGRRRPIMMEHAANFELLPHSTNTLLMGFCLKVDLDLEPPRCSIRELPEIRLLTTNGEKVISIKNERPDVITSYLDLTATLSNWFLLYTREFMKEEIEEFLKQLKEIGAAMNFQIDPPVMMLFDGRWKETFTEIEQTAEKTEGAQTFVMFVDERSENSKEKVKLMQNLYKMKTQCVTFGLVQRNSEKALRGLLLKVHMKVKGVHFTPFIENMNPKHSLGSGNILAFGYSMRPCSIDKSGRNLGIIGIGANFNELWHDFPPNAYFCEREGDCINSECLRKCITKCLVQIFSSKPVEHELPEILLFLRIGLCPSQLIQVVGKEATALKQGCNDFKDGYAPKIVFLCQLPFKTFVDERGVKFNLMKRHCVIQPQKQYTKYPTFSMAINTMFAEHLGTYGLLKNEAGMPISDIQNFTYLLCIDNQLHTITRNVPGLITQCTMVTRAANDLFDLLRKMYPETVPYESEGVVDLASLNELIDRPS